MECCGEHVSRHKCFSMSVFFFVPALMSPLIFALRFKMCKPHSDGKPADLEIDLLFGFIFYAFSVVTYFAGV